MKNWGLKSNICLDQWQKKRKWKIWKIKLDSGDELPLNKITEIPTTEIVIRVINNNIVYKFS